VKYLSVYPQVRAKFCKKEWHIATPSLLVCYLLV
jgi:hypothetical protein